MRFNRREFLAGTAGVIAAGTGSRALATETAALSAEKQPSKPLDFSELRADFPWAESETFLNSAGRHPISTASARAIEEFMEFEVHGPGEGRKEFGEEDLEEVKTLYGKLINAKPTEIAFVQSTLAGENIVAGGLGLHRAEGNVVTDELHYHGGAYIYRSLEKAGLEVRIVKQRDWRTELSDFEKAVDRNTKLVAITLVSNINGFLQDAKALSELAHAHGAYVYADVVQAVGCIPVDVRAMGLDFCSAGIYKWLMGLDGMGFLYVREELQDDVLKPTQFGDRQYDNFRYHNFPGSPAGPADVSWEPRPGAARYEVGTVSRIAAASEREALKYLMGLGIENIQAHAKPLIERVLKEAPALGYPAITLPGMPAPIAAFIAEKPEELRPKLKRANVNAKVKWHQTRISISVFNNQEDIDRLLNAMA